MRRLRIWRGSDRGFSMLETIIAVAILGAIGVGFMTALATTVLSTDITDEQLTAENLLRTQMEYIRDQAFVDSGPGSYDAYVPPAGITLPTGYTITVVAEQYCDSTQCYPTGEIQKITARVFRDGVIVKRLEDLKTKR